MTEESQPLPFHILYADDSENDAFIMKWCLGKLLPAAKFTWFRDGLQLLSYLKRNDFYQNRTPSSGYYIIFLDINMPGLNGFEVIEQIKADPNEELHKIPILMISSSDREYDIEKSNICGAQGYLIKMASYEDTLDQFKSFIDVWVTHHQTPLTTI